MRYLIIADLHGRMPVWQEKDFDAIIQPGDVAGDFKMRPIIKKMMRDFRKDTSVLPSWYDYIGRTQAKEILLNNINKGRKIMEKLNKQGVPVFTIPGNHDHVGYDDEEWVWERKNLWETKILEGLKNVTDVDKTFVETAEHIIVGYGRTNGPELLRKRGYEGFTEKDYKENEARVKKLHEKMRRLFIRAQKRNKPIIFITHVAPYNTKCDKIQAPGSPVDGKHYGSNIAAWLIREFQPKVCVCAHFHEHFGTQLMGKTRILHAGYGPKKNIVLDMTNNRINSYIFRDNGKKVNPKL